MTGKIGWCSANSWGMGLIDLVASISADVGISWGSWQQDIPGWELMYERYQNDLQVYIGTPLQSSASCPGAISGGFNEMQWIMCHYFRFSRWISSNWLCASNRQSFRSALVIRNQSVAIEVVDQNPHEFNLSCKLLWSQINYYLIDVNRNGWVYNYISVDLSSVSMVLSSSL